MRISFGDRILIYLFTALAILLTALLAFRAFSLDAIGALFENLQNAAPGIWWRLIVIGLGAIEVLLGVFTISVITTRRRKKELFVNLNPDKEDGAQVRIAVSAIREMVRQSASSIGGMNSESLDVTLAKNELLIALTLDVDDRQGNVPALTSQLQQRIKQKVQETCGVTVKQVLVTVNSISTEPIVLSIPVETPVGNTEAETTFTPSEEFAETQETVTDDTEQTEAAEEGIALELFPETPSAEETEETKTE